ncbi:hypothetical protein EVB91_124 [Rhizobium phage RHph_I1_18]|nr:hypothetical protein EVB91_124 [Rhizobium phage RHph_I1_18]
MSNIIAISVFIGLAALVGFIYLARTTKYAWILSIPVAFAAYFTIIDQIPKQLGYPVPLEMMATDEAQLLYVAQGKTMMYVMVIERDHDRPRLIEMPASDENKEQLQKLQKKIKEGKPTSIRKKGTLSASGEASFDEGSPPPEPEKE